MNNWNKYLAECFGTFCLVFAGTAAIIVNDIHGGTVTHVGIAMMFGLIVLTMIYAVGDISGAHLNPAVTIGFFASGRLERSFVIPYILAQLTGACLASMLLRNLFPFHESLGSTFPSGVPLQSFVLEVVLTMMLMVVVLRVSSGPKERGITAGVAVGSLIGLEALFAGPISGASMNPARSLAPALFSGHMGEVWIYLTAPILGSLLGVLIASGLRESHSS